jgi:hypothetical protein
MLERILGYRTVQFQVFDGASDVLTEILDQYVARPR